MRLPPADLPFLRERIRELAGRVRDAGETTGTAGADPDAPMQLGAALLQLFEMLARVEADETDAGINPVEINTLSEFGLQLFDELVQLANRLEQPALATEIECLCMPYALWIARHGGEIRHLSPVVNALAHYANRQTRPDAMTALYTHCCELIEATSPSVAEAQTNDKRHPWRLLLLNRAIVATRSQNPDLIEAAFDAIVEHLPQDAARFFAEGMEQMANIDYPDYVRDLVRRYYLEHALPRRLH